MEKILASLFAIALLFASPAFAAKPTAKKDPVQKPVCHTVADAKEDLRIGQESATVEYELTGDALKKFNAALNKKTGVVAPDGMDTLLIFSAKGVPAWLGVLFVKGCVTQMFPVTPESFKQFLSISQGADDDGSI